MALGRPTWLALGLLLLSFHPALAQGPGSEVPVRPASTLDVVGAIEREPGQIVFVGSYLRHRMIAEALHAALTKRGLAVYILTSYHTYLDPNSYFIGLYLAGAKLFLGETRAYYLIAGNQVFTGRGLGVKGEAIMKLEGDRALKEADAAVKAFERAQPLSVDARAIVLHYLQEMKRERNKR